MLYVVRHSGVTSQKVTVWY